MVEESALADRARTVRWEILAIPAVVQLALHIATNGQYGIFRDEYYYLACADRLAWGYVDQPALSIWILAAWKTVFGVSVHWIRVLPGLCGAALVLLAGMTAARLGGGRWAQLFAAVGAGIGGSALVIFGFYSMNCFDFLVWLGAYYLLIRIAQTDDGRWWPWLGVLLGLGLFNKVGVLVLGLALTVSLVATPMRKHLADWRTWAAGLAALVFLLPYVAWNAANGWPTREFIRNATAYKISDMSALEFLSSNILDANPAALPLWLGGLLWLALAKSARRYRFVAVMVVSTWLLFVLQNSKPYYFAASFPVLMAAGGVAWERWTTPRRWLWARWLMLTNLVVGLFVILPIVLPVLPPPRLSAYMDGLGIAPPRQEVGHTSALPQHFSDRFGWQELARTVAIVVDGLPDEDRERAIILGRNYGHSGALEYWSETYDLPPVYGRHNNYWLWGPPAADEHTVVIAIRFDPDDLEEIFDEVVVAGVSETPWALESQIIVSVCRGLKRPIAEVWDEAKIFI
jgi:hypothetical protein